MALRTSLISDAGWVPRTWARYRPSTSSATIWARWHLVEATPISGPARV